MTLDPSRGTNEKTPKKKHKVLVEKKGISCEYPVNWMEENGNQTILSYISEVVSQDDQLVIYPLKWVTF